MLPILRLPIDLALIGATFAALTGIGAKLCRTVHFSSRGLRLLASLSLGLLVFFYLIFILGAAAQIKFVPLTVLCLLTVVIGLFFFYQERIWRTRDVSGSEQIVQWTSFEKSLLCLVLLAGLGALLFGYAPPTGEDELHYQISLPLYWLQVGRLAPIPENFTTFYPLNSQLLFTPLLMLRGALAVKALVWSCGILVLLALSIVARHILKLSRLQTVLALAIFYTMPFTTSLQGTSSSDLLNLFFELSAVSLLWSADEKSRYGKSIVAGFIAGAALGTRPYAAAWIGALGLYTLLVDRRWKETLIFWSIAGVVYLPWPLRTWLLTGNPIYPKALWAGSAEDIYFKAMTTVAQNSFWIDLFHMPMDITYGGLVWGVGVLPVPLALLAWFHADRKNVMRLWFMAFVSLLIYFLAFPWRTHYPRYLGASFPFLALLSAYGFDALIEGIRSSPRLQRTARAWVLLALLVPNVALNLYFGSKRARFFLGLQSWDNYLRQQYTYLEGFDLLSFVENRLPAGSTIQFLGPIFSPRFYYFDKLTFGMARHRPEFYNRTTQGLHHALRQDGIQYVILVRAQFNTLPDQSQAWCWNELSFQTKIVLPPLQEPYFKKILSGPPADLYELAP